jgi:hypothetical protein
LTVSQARSRSRAVSGSGGLSTPLDAQIQAGATHQQFQGQQQRHRRDPSHRLGGRMVGGVGDVEGGRRGCGGGDQAPGVDSPLAGQGRPQDLDGGGQGEAVDQQRRRPPQRVREGAGLDGELRDGPERHQEGQGGDGADQGADDGTEAGFGHGWRSGSARAA